MEFLAHEMAAKVHLLAPPLLALMADVVSAEPLLVLGTVGVMVVAMVAAALLGAAVLADTLALGELVEK
jgi:hypothetical protein